MLNTTHTNSQHEQKVVRMNLKIWQKVTKSVEIYSKSIRDENLVH